MLNKTVKYHNDMNKVALAGFNEKELNLFFSLIYLTKDKKSTLITIPFSELKELSENEDRNKDRFIKSLHNINKKLASLSYQIESEELLCTFSLFNTFLINKKEKTLSVEVNSMFAYLLNDLIGNFTKFELENFVKLKSIYSKNLFKLLKQWESIKEKVFTIEEFKEVLAIPKSYRMSEIDKVVLGAVRRDLPQFFPNLVIEKIKTGRIVTSIKFSWSKYKEKIEYQEDIIVKISRDLEKAFEKASHNRYIKPHIDDDIKIELLELFEDEKILIKGLYYAYKKINKEFKSITYLIRVIKTGAEEQTKKIKVTNNIIQTDRNVSLKEIKEEEIKEKTNRPEKQVLTREEFEKKYQEFLKSQNVSHNEFIKKFYIQGFTIID